MVIILHIPFVKNNNLLPLYEFVSLPIHFNFSAKVSVIPEVGQNNLIAMRLTKLFLPRTSLVVHIWVQLSSAKAKQF